MNDYKSPLTQKPDYLLCTCMGVMYLEIVRAIHAGSTTFEQLQEQFLVGTGCSSCVEEIYQLLQDEVGK